jgi:TP901 family phage tail tape measure protein
MTDAFTVPVVAGMKMAWEETKNFDVQLQNIASIAPEINIPDLSTKLLQLSTAEQSTTESASALAEAFYFIKSAGYDADQALSILEVSTKAASAGLSDTTTAANAITGILHAYGLNASEASHISDVLFTTVDQGVLTFQDLAYGLGRVANTGANAGIDLENLSAAMIVLTRRGIPASEAFTALGQVMQKLISPTAAAKKAVTNFGYSMEDLDLRKHSLTEVLATINEIEATHPGAIFEIFGKNVRALKGVLSLASGGAVEFEEALASLQEVGGRTDEAFAAQTQSMDAQIKMLKNDFMALGIALVQELIPYIKEFMGYLGQLVVWFQALDPEQQKWVLGLIAAAAAIGPILMLLGNFITVIGGVVSAISAVAGFLGISALALTGWGLVIAAVLAAVGYLVYTHWDEIKAAGASFITWVQDSWATLMSWWYDTTHNRMSAIGQIWNNTFGFMKEYFAVFKQNIQMLVQAFHQAQIGDWYGFGASIRQIWDNNWRLFTNLIWTAWSNIKAALQGLWNNIKNWWNGITWKDLGKRIGDGILTGMNNMGNALRNAIIAIGKSMLAAFKGFWGIHSPSKLMAEQFEYLAQGAMIGWQSTFQFSPSMVGQQVNNAYSMPTTQIAGVDQQNQLLAAVKGLQGGSSSSMNEEMLSRAFRDAVLLLRD